MAHRAAVSGVAPLQYSGGGYLVHSLSEQADIGRYRRKGQGSANQRPAAVTGGLPKSSRGYGLLKVGLPPDGRSPSALALPKIR